MRKGDHNMDSFMTSNRMPTYDEFFNPVLVALKALGGSATNAELEESVIEVMRLAAEVTEVAHGDTNQTEVGYRIAWARTYLKKFGVLQNSSRGVWSLTETGRRTETIDPASVKRVARDQYLTSKVLKPVDSVDSNDNVFSDETSEDEWQDLALKTLKNMDPIAFERLCQRLLRESGFIEVEVTQRSNDGGIDGRGILRIGGLISFTVMFQAKRYKDSVGPGAIRDFRGALMGRADKGLFITTGRFTHEAQKEAVRDGATPLDLIDGSMLVEKLKDLRLGIETKMVEKVEVNLAWFESI